MKAALRVLWVLGSICCVCTEGPWAQQWPWSCHLDVQCTDRAGAERARPRFQRLCTTTVCVTLTVTTDLSSTGQVPSFEQTASSTPRAVQPQLRDHRDFCLIKDQNKFRGQVVWLL